MSSEGSAGDFDWAWLNWLGLEVCLAAGLHLRVEMRDALVECSAPQVFRARLPVHSLGTVTTTGTSSVFCGRTGRASPLWLCAVGMAGNSLICSQVSGCNQLAAI